MNYVIIIILVVVEISCHAEQFKKCTYCLKVFNDENSLADHIADTYTSCMYFCTQCFYRAYTESHVLVHEVNYFLLIATYFVYIL